MILAEEHSNILLPAPADLIWGTVAFVIVAIAIFKFAWPSFSKMLDERREKIEDGLAAADRALEQVAAERKTMANEREDALREAAKIRTTAQENAKDIIARAQQEATEESRRITEAAQAQIKADTEAAARHLRADVGSVASTLAGKIVGEQVKLDPSVNKSVVDSFLDQLEANAFAQGSRN